MAAGYDSYDFEDLLELAKKIKTVGDKFWMNVGIMKEEHLRRLKPYLAGVVGAVDCINPKLHDELCPTKPIKPIEEMYAVCDKLGLKKSITIVVGLGETINDIPLLKNFINKYKIDRITFYALNPHEGTMFTKGPETGYYLKWIKSIRDEFPKMEIVAGTWSNRVEEIHELLNAGADNITRFPAIRLFGSTYAKQIEEECRKAGRKFEGTMTSKEELSFDLSKIKDEELKSKVKIKLDQYLSKM